MYLRPNCWTLRSTRNPTTHLCINVASFIVIPFVLFHLRFLQILLLLLLLYSHNVGQADPFSESLTSHVLSGTNLPDMVNFQLCPRKPFPSLSMEDSNDRRKPNRLGVCSTFAWLSMEPGPHWSKFCSSTFWNRKP